MLGVDGFAHEEDHAFVHVAAAVLPGALAHEGAHRSALRLLLVARNVPNLGAPVIQDALRDELRDQREPLVGVLDRVSHDAKGPKRPPYRADKKAESCYAPPAGLASPAQRAWLWALETNRGVRHGR